ncbi:uncharacterized protein FA14DRAFT_95270 [Meira miltonrushii]|uniref:Adhesin domain-containing protein n=1 Tax=Meira miltonrushii TaxID=1280837 RepID=A0A316V338_9BASI|nr:uncharacterized protein FA14DRAFT_95270 [Meira miltonrushii]PWN31408.1 hypothetical protein FA14DRAFT_95270 [Meira miltonrushii]
MAIINTKAIEANQEAEQSSRRREAEEYAARNDTLWTQAPPAYEEVASITTSRGNNDVLCQPIQGPSWSEVENVPQKVWLSPHIPQYTCSASFSLSASTATFIRANGTGYNGWLRIGSSSELREDEWKSIHGDAGMNRIGVVIQARFTHRDLLDLISLNKTREERDNQIISEGISLQSGEMGTRINRFVNLTIIAYLPEPIYRTPVGLARDGSSYIPGLDLFTDNLQIIFDGSNSSSKLSFSKIVANTRIPGITLRMNLLANESIVLLSSLGQISDFLSSKTSTLTIAAPKISIVSQNGSIQLSTIIAVDEVNLSTINGGINVTQVAVAKKVSCASREGSLRGQFSAYDNLSLKTTTAMVEVDVIASRDTYKERLRSSGLLAILDPSKEQEILAEQSCTTSWRKLQVAAFTQVGSTSVKFIDQDTETQLLSEVTSMTGLVNVAHSSAFQGKVEFETTIGTIAVHDSFDESEQKRKAFEIDIGHSEAKVGKYVQGRVFSVDPGWDAVGPDRQHAFPLSYSRMYSNIGRIESSFD